MTHDFLRFSGLVEPRLERGPNGHPDATGASQNRSCSRQTHDRGSIDILAISRQESAGLFLGAMNDLDIRRQKCPRGQRDTIISLETMLILEGLSGCQRPCEGGTFDIDVIPAEAEAIFF